MSRDSGYRGGRGPLANATTHLNVIFLHNALRGVASLGRICSTKRRR